MVIYIENKLFIRKNICRDRFVFRCRWVVSQDHVPIWFVCGIRKIIYKLVSITWAYLARDGSELRRVPTVTKH